MIDDQAGEIERFSRVINPRIVGITATIRGVPRLFAIRFD